MDLKTSLLVDIGNTRLKWQCRQKNKTLASSAGSYGDTGIAEFLENTWSSLPAPDQVVISSVAIESVNHQINEWVEKHWSLPPHFVRSVDPYPGVINGYVKPEQLGVDRWVTIISAYVKFKGPVAVVDCGTAVTIDLVDGGGKHRGGWILPGLNTSVNCLRKNTAIPGFDDAEPQLQPARSTAEAVANGSLLTIVGAIGRIAKDLTEQTGFNKVRWVLTGGDADRLSTAIDIDYQRIDELMMDGLQLLAEQQEQNR